MLIVASVLALFVASSLAQQTACGQVMDGDKASDISVHTIGEPFTARWNEFEPKLAKDTETIVQYEWAVVSSSVVDLKEDSMLCGTKPFFDGLPDVAPWASTGRKTIGVRSFEADNIKLTPGSAYHVVVRAVAGDGRLLHAVSDGFVAQEPTPIAAPSSGSQHLRERSVGGAQTVKRSLVPIVNAVADNGFIIDANAVCPIDEANRCRHATVSIGDFLTELYGPPEWLTIIDPFREIYVLGPVNDDDDFRSSSSFRVAGIPIGAVLGIAFGVAGAMFLIMLIISALTMFNRKSDKFKTNVRRTDNYEEF